LEIVILHFLMEFKEGTLDMSFARLMRIPPLMSSKMMLDVCVLYLDHNNLVELPDEIVEKFWSRVQVIYMQSNYLGSIPNSFSSLKDLRVLHLYSNQIEKIPESLCQLVYLQVLYLNDNRLRSLPASMCHMKSLKRLTLHNNLLVELPFSLYMLMEKLNVRLEGNPLLQRIDYGIAQSNHKSVHIRRVPQLPKTLLQICRKTLLSVEFGYTFGKMNPREVLLPLEMGEYLSEKKRSCDKCQSMYYETEGVEFVRWFVVCEDEDPIPFVSCVCSLECAYSAVTLEIVYEREY